MSFERWGSLAVDDHVDTSALVANVLLYDRLVFPVVAQQPDRNERAYWVAHGWDPDLQEKRLEQLGELAIRRPWSQQLRKQYKSRLNELQAEQLDADRIDTRGLTRHIIAQGTVVEKPPGVSHVHVIAAYNSLAGLRADFQVADAKDHAAAQALLLKYRLAVPDGHDPDVALASAIDLSKDATFRARRADLFDWQDRAVQRGYSPQDAVDEIVQLSQRYNKEVERACGAVRLKFAFVISGIGLSFALGNPLPAAATAALSLLKFGMIDSSPAINSTSTRAAAMFHDIEDRIGMALKEA